MYELDCLSQKPTPELSGDLEQIISATAPDFFNLVKFLLVDEIYMGIARLLDPADQGTNINLTLETIIKSSTSANSHQRISAMDQLQKVKGMFSQGSTVRNKLLAHRDYKTSLNYSNEIKAIQVDPDTIGKIIVCIDNIIRKIAPQHTLPDTIPKYDEKWLGAKLVIDHLRNTVEL